MADRPIDRLTAPLLEFMKVGSAGGIVLVFAALIAMIAANSPGADAWSGFWSGLGGITVGGEAFSKPLGWWVNDLLMAVFFLVVGLEIKRELVRGELRDPRRVALPVVAAVGGALVPAGIFVGWTLGTPAVDGWAVPMATDIAFVVGALALLGDRVPRGLKVMLLSLAIVDDLIAVGIIALVFSDGLSPLWLGAAAVGLGTHVALVRLGVRNLLPYAVVWLGVWGATLGSGLHPTIAGVAIGLATPMSRDADGCFAEHLEHLLHPWSAFLIMPVFALANAGVPLSPEAVASPIAIAVTLGLVLGKPIGIGLAAWGVVKLRLGALPQGVTWPVLLGGALLCGIGFTMSLFIAGLALDVSQLDGARTGILLGSLLAGGGGMLALYLTLGKHPEPATPLEEAD